MNIITPNQQVNEFIVSLEKDLKKHGVKFKIHLSHSIQYEGERINGSFSDDPLELEISVHKPLKKWFPILVHESCHFDQWKEGIRLWGQAEKIVNFFEWTSGKKEFSQKKVEKAINISRDLELDCERRTVEKIKKFNLPINLEEYTKKAAAYVLFYNFVKESRSWYKAGKEPYNIPKIIEKMPNTLNGDFSTLTSEMTILFRKNLSL